MLYENRSKEELSKAKLDKISLRLVTVFMGSSKIGHWYNICKALSVSVLS